jgi:hypothetical protein
MQFSSGQVLERRNVQSAQHHQRRGKGSRHPDGRGGATVDRKSFGFEHVLEGW